MAREDHWTGALLCGALILACSGETDHPPTAPGNLHIAGVSASAVRIAWTASSDDHGVTTYAVDRDGSHLADSRVSTFTDTGLEPGTQYCYTVVAVDTKGQRSEPSSMTCPTTTMQFALTVERSGTGSGRIVANPPGIDCGSDCTSSYDQYQWVTLTATPASGSTFAGWSGCSPPAAASCVVLLSEARWVTATFDGPTLTVVRDGNGTGTVISSPTGVSCGIDCAEPYAMGTQVTLIAIPGTPSSFSGWQGCTTVDGASCTVDLLAATTVTASFDLPATLTVTRDGSGTGTVTSSPPGIDCGTDCDETFRSDTTVTLTASAVGDSTFGGWQGCSAMDGATCLVDVSAAITVTATFHAPAQLTVVRGGAGTGTVTSSPAGIDCGTDCTEAFPGGAIVTLTAVPASGLFTAWDGCISASGNTCTVQMTSALMVTANFSPGERLEVVVSGSGSGAVISSPGGIDCAADCSASFASGTLVGLIATPMAGSTFARWDGCTYMDGAYGELCRIDLRGGAIVTVFFEASSGPPAVATDSRPTVATGPGRSFAATPDGTLRAWGDNTSGALGGGTIDDRPSPLIVGSAFASIAAGDSHAAALDADGALWSWGRNDHGQLGDGTWVDRASPVLVGIGFHAVAAGAEHTVAVKRDGTLWAWGSDGSGQLGDGETGAGADEPSPIQIGDGFASVAAGPYETLVVKADGTLWRCGDASRPSLVPIGTGFAAVAAGGTLAIKADGTLWTLGADDASHVLIGTGFATAAAGSDHFVAVKTDGTLWSWGRNDDGQLGDGTTAPRTSPVLVGSGFTSAAAGRRPPCPEPCAPGSAGAHTVAMKWDGSVWTWGADGDGQLGDGPPLRDATSRSRPRRLAEYALTSSPDPPGSGLYADTVNVDDDLTVTLNGIPIVSEQDWVITHLSVRFTARPGDVLRVVASNGIGPAQIEPLYLHRLSDGAVQALDENGAYAENAGGGAVFYDRSFVVE